MTRDDLPSFPSLVAWGAQVGLLRPDEATRLASLPSSATEPAHAESIGLRAILDRAFGAVAKGHAVQAADLDALKALLADARSCEGLRPDTADGGRLGWTWIAPADPRTPAMKVALAAGDLLVHGDLSRVKRCPGPEGCGCLFDDAGRNRSRRWCSMEECGGRAKARRFAAAHRHDG